MPSPPPPMPTEPPPTSPAPRAPPLPPLAPGAAILTSAYFTIKEEYFQGSHVTGEPAFTDETADLEASVLATLTTHGLNAQTVAMKVVDVGTGMQQTIHWRVDVAYLGDPIAIDAMFVVSMGQGIAGLADPVHRNSMWLTDQALTTVSHIPAP